MAIAMLAAVLAIPSQAFAKSSCSDTNSDPTSAMYCSTGGVYTGNNGNEGDAGNAGEVEGVSAESTTPVAAVSSGTESTESSSGTLPFTGLDVGILALVAAALVGTGLLLRRITQPRMR